MRHNIFDASVNASIRGSVESAMDLKNADVMISEMTFLGIDDSGMVAFELPRWVDQEIESGIGKMRSSGETNMVGRCTWGSLRFGEPTHVPVVVAAFGNPSRSLVLVSVCTTFWEKVPAFKWLNSVFDRASLSPKGQMPDLPDLFFMPKVILWDGNRDVLPRMLGYTFEECMVMPAALSRMFWPVQSLAHIGTATMMTRHQEEPTGTLHLTVYEDGFLVPTNVGGGWLTR